MNTVKLMNATTGRRSVTVCHAITVFLSEEPGFRGKRAKLSQSGDHDLDSGNRREPTWSHGISEDALGEAGGPSNIRERLAPARGMLLAFVLGLILWGVGIYLIATVV